MFQETYFCLQCFLHVIFTVAIKHWEFNDNVTLMKWTQAALPRQPPNDPQKTRVTWPSLKVWLSWTLLVVLVKFWHQFALLNINVSNDWAGNLCTFKNWTKFSFFEVAEPLSVSLEQHRLSSILANTLAFRLLETSCEENSIFRRRMFVPWPIWSLSGHRSSRHLLVPVLMELL